MQNILINMADIYKKKLKRLFYYGVMLSVCVSVYYVLCVLSIIEEQNKYDKLKTIIFIIQ